LFLTLDEEERDGLNSDWVLYGVYDPFKNWDFSYCVWDVARLYVEYIRKAKINWLEEEEVVRTLNFMQCDQSERDELYDSFSFDEL